MCIHDYVFMIHVCIFGPLIVRTWLDILSLMSFKCTPHLFSIETYTLTKLSHLTDIYLAWP